MNTEYQKQVCRAIDACNELKSSVDNGDNTKEKVLEFEKQLKDLHSLTPHSCSFITISAEELLRATIREDNPFVDLTVEKLFSVMITILLTMHKEDGEEHECCLRSVVLLLQTVRGKLKELEKDECRV
nr:MAG TPA: hypothetical protein [Herelleviridae sp.]